MHVEIYFVHEELFCMKLPTFMFKSMSTFNFYVKGVSWRKIIFVLMYRVSAHNIVLWFYFIILTYWRQLFTFITFILCKFKRQYSKDKRHVLVLGEKIEYMNIWSLNNCPKPEPLQTHYQNSLSIVNHYRIAFIV